MTQKMESNRDRKFEKASHWSCHVELELCSFKLSNEMYWWAWEDVSYVHNFLSSETLCIMLQSVTGDRGSGPGMDPVCFPGVWPEVGWKLKITKYFPDYLAGSHLTLETNNKIFSKTYAKKRLRILGECNSQFNISIFWCWVRVVTTSLSTLSWRLSMLFMTPTWAEIYLIRGITQSSKKLASFD